MDKENINEIMAVIFTLLFLLLVYIIKDKREVIEFFVIGGCFYFGYFNISSFVIGTPMRTGKGILYKDKHNSMRSFILIIAVFTMFLAIIFTFSDFFRNILS